MISFSTEWHDVCGCGWNVGPSSSRGQGIYTEMLSCWHTSHCHHRGQQVDSWGYLQEDRSVWADRRMCRWVGVEWVYIMCGGVGVSISYDRGYWLHCLVVKLVTVKLSYGLSGLLLNLSKKNCTKLAVHNKVMHNSKISEDRPDLEEKKHPLTLLYIAHAFFRNWWARNKSLMIILGTFSSSQILHMYSHVSLILWEMFAYMHICILYWPMCSLSVVTISPPLCPQANLSLVGSLMPWQQPSKLTHVPRPSSSHEWSRHTRARLSTICKRTALLLPW